MNDYKFGNFLCQLRTEKGLSQSQLGYVIGVSNKAVSKWEMGVSKPRPDMLVTLATMFGVTVEELLAGERNASTEKDERKESRNNNIKLWTGEYLKKKQQGLISVLISVLLPVVFIIWVGVAVSLNIADNAWAPIVAMVIIFAEVIAFALIFVFYGSARRLKRILYATYHEHAEEITALILQKKQNIPLLKWEKICTFISSAIIFLCATLRYVLYACRIGKDIVRIIGIVAVIIPMGLACILEIVVGIHYLIRVCKIRKQNELSEK